MSLTKLNDDLAIIAKLDDEPNDVGGLTADELKAAFDRSGEIIQEYINGTLLPELEGSGAASQLGAQMDGETTSIQGAIDVLRTASQKSGNIPTGGHTGDVLVKKSDEVYDSEWRELFTTVEFKAADWVDGGSEYTLTIPQSAHKRTGEGLNCLLRHLVDGQYVENTWAVAGTRSHLDADTGSVVLTGTDAYDGSVFFFG